MDDEIFMPHAEEPSTVSPPLPVTEEPQTDLFDDIMTPETDNEAVSDKTEKTAPAVSFAERKKQIKTLLERCGLPDMLLLRIITMYLFIFAGTIVRLRDTMEINAISQWQDFVGQISLGEIAFLMLLGTATLTVIHYVLPKYWRIIDPLAAIGATLYFDVALLWKRDNLYLAIGMMLVSLVLIAYAVGKLRSHRLTNKLHWSICGIIVAALAVLTTVFIIGMTIYRHLTFGSMVHDFGLFAQMYHSLAEDLTAVTTMERDRLVSHFLVHASYIFYLLVPIFKLFPFEETLLVAQGLLAMGGIIPLFLIAKRRNFKGLSLIFIGAMYVFCSALIAPCFYDFHENAFLPTLLMWTLWAVDGKKTVPFYIFSILTCIVKEDAPLYIICIGLYWFFEQKGSWKRIHGLIATAAAGVYMMQITAWLTENGDGNMMTSSRFGHLLIDPEGGLVDVVINSISNPGYFFSLLVQESTFVFLMQIMLPLLFMPLFTKKIHRFLLILPFVITILVVGAKYGYAANIDFQYIFGPATMLLFMTLVNVADLKGRARQDIPVLLGCAAFILTMGTVSHHINKREDYNNNAAYFQTLEATLDAIPEDAVIAGNPFLIPHLSDRDEVYIFDMNDIDQNTNEVKDIEKYDFIVLKNGENSCLAAEPILGEYGFVKLKTGVSDRVTIFMSPDYDLPTE